jgi:hypothetical protein
LDVIASADSAIAAAAKEGKDVSEARVKLAAASSALAAEDYAGATSLAQEAKLLALNAKQKAAPASSGLPLTPAPKGLDLVGILAALVVIGIVGAGAYLLLRPKK